MFGGKMIHSKVVIIGGGFGGLSAAQNLKKGVAEVIVLDRHNHHLFQPLLYQVASAALSPNDIAKPIREILGGQSNAIVLMAQVEEIRKEKRELLLSNKQVLHYDYLIVAAGARHSYFGNDHWEAHAPGLKTAADAIKIRERMLLSFERAERSDLHSDAEKHLNFFIVGGGPTGVELAGSIAEIAYDVMLRDYHRINTKITKITLVEAGPRILPMFSESLSTKSQRYLESMGVEVLTNQRVTNITEEGLTIGDRFHPTTNVIWAAGNQASPLLKTLDCELDRQGRAIVGHDCSIPGNPEIFVIGDAACHTEEGAEYPLPAVAQVALQQGKFVAKIIRKDVPAGERPNFKYNDRGMMATIGKAKAVVEVGARKFTGFIAWLLWCFVHVMYLVGFRNRYVVMVQWFFAYIFGSRGARIIGRPIPEEGDDEHHDVPPI